MKWLCCECFREGDGPVPDACPSCWTEGYWLTGEGSRDLKAAWDEICVRLDKPGMETRH